jgi:pimeloyl-ACP methyl ester carboxylesterase
MPFADTQGARTYYEATGHGPPLVFVHSAFLDQRMWREQVDAFAGDYRVVTYDLRGHGRTGPTDADAYTVDLLADDLADLLDTLEVERPVVCGLSLGGMVAQAFASRYPERSDWLALADTAVSAQMTLEDRLITHALLPRPFIKGLVQSLGSERFTDVSFWVSDWFQATSDADSPLRPYIRDAMQQIAPNEYAKVFDMLYTYDAQPLDRIEADTLVLCGEHEPRHVRSHSRVLAEEIARAEHHTIRGAGHLSNLDQPKAFSAYLRAWLDEQDVLVKHGRPVEASDA